MNYRSRISIRSPWSRAFSLVELLVVLGIIAILAALLLPALVQAKGQGKNVACIANLRQIGQACSMYMTDYDESLPPDMPHIVAWNGHFVDCLKPYGTSLSLYQCPDSLDGNNGKAMHLDYVSRYAIAFSREDHFKIVWRVLPTENFVLAYCPWHRFNTSEWVGKPNGFFNAVRITGGVQHIPTAEIKEHQEDWGGFGPDVDPNMYRWLVFPGETFPPVLEKTTE